VDRRYRLSKRLQNELGFFGGGYLGDETHNSWVVGGRYFLHLNNTFALGASYSYTPVITDWSSTFGQSLRTKQQHLIDGEVMISNDAAFRAGNTIVELDLYFTLGLGVIRINQQNMPMGIIGGGAKFYTGYPWLTVRFDVNSYIHPTPNPNGDTLNSDMSILAGVSFLFPQRKPPEED
jgi:outer membrane beta-barrel protein